MEANNKNIDRNMRYDENCFACGKNNPVGLKLEFYEQDGYYITEFIPSKHYEGYPGILHGGITSTILDEVMGRYLYDKDYIALTAELTVRFKKSIPIEKKIIAYTKIVSQKARMVEMTAEIKLEDGVVAAQAKGKFMIKGTV